jgi:hypothetical protein
MEAMMKDNTIETVLEAVDAIKPVPHTKEERERCLRQELEKRSGQAHIFANPIGEKVYSPVCRYYRFVEQGN